MGYKFTKEYHFMAGYSHTKGGYISCKYPNLWKIGIFIGNVKLYKIKARLNVDLYKTEENKFEKSTTETYAKNIFKVCNIIKMPL